MPDKKNKNNNLIIAYFPDLDAAKDATKKLRHWDKNTDDIKLGSVGIVTLDKKGHLKTHKVGARATGAGAKWGVTLGAVAGIFSGGIGLIGGAVAGATVGAVSGAIFHKSLGMDDDDRARLAAHLQDGGAALAVMVDDYEVGPTKAELASLDGEVESYVVSEATVAHLEKEHSDEIVEDAAAGNGSVKAILHYHRPNGDYEGWGLHVWTGYEGIVEWENPLPLTGSDEFGLFFEVPLADAAVGLAYIIHKGDEKDLLDDQYLDFKANGREVWITQNTPGYVIPATS